MFTFSDLEKTVECRPTYRLHVHVCTVAYIMILVKIGLFCGHKVLLKCEKINSHMKNIHRDK